MERHILISQLKTLHSVKDSTKYLFASAFAAFSLSKKQTINLNETNDRSIYYLIEGLTLMLDVIDDFLPKHFYPILLHQPGRFFIPPNRHRPDFQLLALAHSKLLRASIKEIQQMITMDPAIIDILNYIHAQDQEQQFEHIKLLKATPAELRYDLLAHQLGVNFHQLPQKYLAPYLGISRKHLGRINRLKLIEYRNGCTKPTTRRLV